MRGPPATMSIQMCYVNLRMSLFHIGRYHLFLPYRPLMCTTKRQLLCIPSLCLLGRPHEPVLPNVDKAGQLGLHQGAVDFLPPACSVTAVECGKNSAVREQTSRQINHRDPCMCARMKKSINAIAVSNETIPTSCLEVKYLF